MRLKVDDSGKVALKDGKPVYETSDGKEVAVDVPDLFTQIESLNGEAKKHRLNHRDAEKKLAAYGELDPEEAVKAVETVKNLEAKKLVDAGEVETLKAQITEGYEKKLADAAKALEAEQATTRGLLITNGFAGSKVLEKTTLTPEIAEAFFGGKFKVEDGKAVGYLDEAPIMSHENPGQFAGFDEALERMIGAYPRKDEILRASDNSGSGGGGNQGGGGNAGDARGVGKIKAGLEKQGA